MARLMTPGAEWGNTTEEYAGFSTVGGDLGGAVTIGTAVKRTGVAAFKSDSGAGNLDPCIALSFTGVLGRNYYQRGYFYIPSATGYPTARTRIMCTYRWQLNAQCCVYLETTGRLQLFNGANVGSSSEILAQDTWYRVETRNKIAAGSADDEMELLLNGVQVASVTGATVDTLAPTHAEWGIHDVPGANKVLYFDDCALNDDQTGGSQTSFPGAGQVVLLVPTSDNARGTWTGGALGTTNLFDAMNNLPPIGTATETDLTQIENATNSASSSGDFNMTTYAAAGLQGSAGVAAVTMMRVAHGEDSATGTKTGSFTVVSNPALGTTPTFTFGADAGALGTYPTLWTRTNSAVTYDQAIAMRTAPVARVTKTTASTAVGSVCQMAILVDVVDTTPHRRDRVFNNAVYRM